MKEHHDSRLTRNGYAPSIMQDDYGVCYRCGTSSGKLDFHEIYGASNRQKSKRLGLWVTLCRACHNDAHGYNSVMIALKQAGQVAAMQTYGWTKEDFIREIGRNYL